MRSYVQHDPLTRDEQRELCRLRDEGDETAAWRLAESVFPLAISIATKFCERRGWSDVDAAISAAYLGAHRAATKLDPELASITTYSHQWILNFLQREWLSIGRGVIWVPVTADKRRHSNKAIAALRCAAFCDIGLGDDIEPPLAVDCDPGADMESAEEMDLVRRRVHRVLRRLDPRHALVLRRRHWDGRTHREIAEELGVSKARVGQIEIDARGKFRERWLACRK